MTIEPMTRRAKQLVLVRHAAATGQEANAALTAEGEQQAHVLADVLLRHDIQHVISSPFARALDSVAPFCRRVGVRAETDDRLVERVLSTSTLPDWRDHLRRSFSELDYQVDGGESSRTAQARGTAAVRAALATGKRCAIVTHGNLLALILNSIDSTVGFDEWARLSNPDAFALQVDGYRMTGFNRVWNPGPQRGE